jgi:hypothetical protein
VEEIIKWINNKTKVVAAMLPTLVHTEPASFSCGYNTGYKQCLLDLLNFVELNIKEFESEEIR